MYISTNHSEGYKQTQRKGSPKINKVFKVPKKGRNPSVRAILASSKQFLHKLQQNKTTTNANIQANRRTRTTQTTQTTTTIMETETIGIE